MERYNITRHLIIWCIEDDIIEVMIILTDTSLKSLPGVDVKLGLENVDWFRRFFHKMRFFNILGSMASHRIYVLSGGISKKKVAYWQIRWTRPMNITKSWDNSYPSESFFQIESFHDLMIFNSLLFIESINMLLFSFPNSWKDRSTFF